MVMIPLKRSNLFQFM